MGERLIVLTGHSRGLGAAIAAQLLQPGQTVVGISRRRNDALAALATQRGATLEQWAVDLADTLPAAQRLRDWLAGFAADRFARVDLINNAGAITPPAPLRDSDLAALAATLRIDLEATVLLSAAFLDATRGWRGDRRILNISSGLGRRAMASSAVYCAAKAGMDHLTRSLALEEALVNKGARVMSLAPGVIDTDMQVQLRGADAAAFPDRERFVALQREGLLTSAEAAAARVLACLERADFGREPIGDVRELA
ncbi:SDR family NAD(P)-dependent oxidoreductase [Piscinibacter aquaticus]|uniref:SDR family NAD(P)-dependent oxidoreductase n=1 Tax=Piscinibacter aquaticus TaxID=392597 RepID=A0A5C6U041_9BURK|nr:SDR family NAD(P)-dependent oxidoreductase [Piscinibacter aquaticus]